MNTIDLREQTFIKSCTKEQVAYFKNKLKKIPDSGLIIGCHGTDFVNNKQSILMIPIRDAEKKRQLCYDGSKLTDENINMIERAFGFNI